jgi:tetratricopeptide (TPR) repeat protein
MLPLLAALAALQLADPRVDFEQGREAANQGDLSAASAKLERAAAQAPSWGLAWLELADVQLRAGAAPGAIERSLEAARSLAPENPRAWLLSARFLEQRGARDEAVAAYARAVELRPSLVEARERMGLLLLSADRPGDALPHLQAAFAVRREDRALRANLADAYERLGDLKRAEAELRALADEGPGTVYRRRLAAFYERTGRPKKAAAELRKPDAGPRRARAMRPLLPSVR